MTGNNKQQGKDELINEILKTPPSCSLPDDFAESVAAKVVRRFAWRQYLNEFLIYLIAFLGLIIVTVIIAFTFHGADWQVWKHFLMNNTDLIINLQFLAIFVLFADKVLLPYYSFKFARKKIV